MATVNPQTGFITGSVADRQAISGAIPKKVTTPTVQPTKTVQPVQPTTQPTQSYLTPENLIQGGYNEGRDAGAKFSPIFGENVMPSTAEEQMRDLERGQRADEAYQNQIQALQSGMNRRQFDATKRESEAAQKGAVQAFAQNREGAMSSSAQGVIDRYKGISNERMSMAADQVNLAQMQMEEAKRQLKNAQKGQSQQAIERYMGQVANAEMQIKQANADLANAESQALSEARQFQQSERQNVETFNSILSSGVQIDLPGVMNLASSLGVPSDLAVSYFSATEQIRNDKTLDSQEKQIAFQMAQEDFNDRVTGFQTKEAQKMRDYERLVKQGYDPVELASVMDIPNEKNPMYMAELALKQAQINVANRELQGLPVGFKEFQELADAEASMNAYMGTGGTAFVPEYSLEGIGVEWDGGRLNFVLPTNEDGTLKDFQCGEFVNRCWGLQSGSGGGFGSKLSDKQATINNHGINIGSINSSNYQTMIKPGMAFVSNQSEYGHVGIITQVMPNGEFLTMEANIVGDMGDGSPPTEQRRNINDKDLLGFVPPPNAIVQGKGSDLGLSNSQLKILNSWDGKTVPTAWQGTPQQLDTAFNALQDKKMDASLSLAERARLSVGGGELLDKAATKMESFQTVAFGLQQLEDAFEGVQVDKDAPIWKELRKKNPWDKKRVEVDAIITGMVPGLARGVFGEVGVLTDADIERYTKLIPTLGNPKDQRDLLVDMIKTSLRNGTSSVLANAAKNNKDVSAYADLIEFVNEKPTKSGAGEADDEIGGYLKSIQNRPVATEEDALIDAELQSYFGKGTTGQW